MKQVSLYFNTKKPGKRIPLNIIQLVYLNYYKAKSAKEIAGVFSLKIRIIYNIIYRAEKDGCIRRKKIVMQRVERKIIKKGL